MQKIILTISIIASLLVGCNNEAKTKFETIGNQSKIIVEMIEAVNEKNPEKYVSGFADSVQVFVESEIKVEGKENLKSNRANHFKNYPNVRSEIQHLVEIDDKVILHDKVWLKESDKIGQNIVEIFTFKDGKVSRIDVIQPKDLFKK